MRRLMLTEVKDGEEVMNGWKLIGMVESDGEGDAAGLVVEIDFSEYSEVFVVATTIESGTTRRIVISSVKAWYDGIVHSTFSGTDLATLFTRIDVIDDFLYGYGGYNTGYGGIAQSQEIKVEVPIFSPRCSEPASSFKYIRYDTNSNGAIPAGEVLKVYGR